MNEHINPRRRFLSSLRNAALISLAPFPRNPESLTGIWDHGDPTDCDFAPPGEYIKDHTFVYTDGWWHLFSISGTRGYYHGYNGNEETFSWSISKNLVDWEFRGHVIHPSLRANTFDQHEVWAPFCIKSGSNFFMFYTGVVHPHRPMEYRRLGSKSEWIGEGHKETQGLAISTDLTDWLKTDDPEKGLGIPGRDSCVVRDEKNNRWLLYSTGGSREKNGIRMHEVFISQSADLFNWKFTGTCALIPRLDVKRNYGPTVDNWEGFRQSAGTTESMVVMKHPVSDQWLLMGNWQYALSDDPLNFMNSEINYYDNRYNGSRVDLGFACEIIRYQEKWYRSAVIGDTDQWRLAITEIEWVKEGAFRIVRPGKINTLF